MKEQPLLNWINAVLGLWLTVSPFVLPFAAPLASEISLTFVLLGLIVVALAFAAGSGRELWPRGAIAFLGAIVLVLPWIMRFSGSPVETWNACVSGALLVFLGVGDLAGVEPPDVRRGG